MADQGAERKKEPSQALRRDSLDVVLCGLCGAVEKEGLVGDHVVEDDFEHARLAAPGVAHNVSRLILSLLRPLSAQAAWVPAPSRATTLQLTFASRA